MGGSLPQMVLLVLAGIGLLGIPVLLIKKWRFVLKLGLVVLVVVGALVALCRPLGLPFCRDGGGAGGPVQGGGGSGPGGPPVAVQDTGSGLQVSNRSGEPLFIRAAFVIPTGGGNVGVCNPYGPPGNRTVPLPGAPSSPYDQVLGPFQAIMVHAGSCPNHTGYSVWARNSNREIVFEEHR